MLAVTKKAGELAQAGEHICEGAAYGTDEQMPVTPNMHECGLTSPGSVGTGMHACDGDLGCKFGVDEG